jgi:septum formation protein
MEPMLVLASASPRRKELLNQAGYEFEVVPANIPEDRQHGEGAIEFVTRLAREKAEFAFEHMTADDLLVLGADTIVVTAEEILGKPRDAEDAARMLRALSGRVHRVITGVCLISARGSENVAEITSVTMGELTAGEIADYVASGEPMDKAGAYAIQGRAARWIPRIEGCYFNVVGLPLARVAGMLDRAGFRTR